jgi:hypothetical protein
MTWPRRFRPGVDVKARADSADLLLVVVPGREADSTWH